MISTFPKNDFGNFNKDNDRSKCNLIVNYLPQSLKEEEFCQLFEEIGPIKALKLMCDKQTGCSFGYGFVDYQNPEDAMKAIDQYNGFVIENKRLKVAYAKQNTEETTNTESANLYIRNIPITYDESNLQELFSKYGEVAQVRILRDQATQVSRRIGFVIMATNQMAQTAIANLDNQVPPNSNEPIHVKFADEDGRKQRQQHHQSRNNYNSYNNNNNNNNFQNANSNSSSFYDNFQTHHNSMQYNNGMQHHKFKNNNYRDNNNRMNPKYHNENNFADSYGQQNKQLQQHQQHQHQQQPQQQQLQQQQQQQTQDKTGQIVYVYGIGPHANESDLYTLFQNVGRISRVNVIKNQTSGVGKGYAFVTFETYEEACNAVRQVNGFIFNNRPLQVSLKN